MKSIRLAFVAGLALALAFCAGTSPAFADITVAACVPVPMPGPENTLNPRAPKGKQVQDTRQDCVAVTFPDPKHQFDKSKITDFLHDIRAIA